MRNRLPAMCLFVLAAAPAWPQAADPIADPPDPQSGQNGQNVVAEAKPQKKNFRFEFKNHPSLRMGEWFRMDFRLKFQHEFRTFDPEVTTDEGELANLRKFRVGIEGYVTKDIEYSIERELRNEIGDLFELRTRPTKALWRDVYGNYRYFRRFQVRGGQFKLPFGMDQLHYSSKGEMINRSLIGNFLAPGRDVGFMLHGKF